MKKAAIASVKVAEPEGKAVDIVLFPDGEVTSTKGTFVVDDSSWKSVFECFASRGNELVVDYEHQTHGTDDHRYQSPDGRAPAAGWIKSLRYEPGKGIVAAVEWTDDARKLIRTKQYKYLSPVFNFDRDTGRVTKVISAALTNLPAIDRMIRVAAKRINDMKKQTESTSTIVAQDELETIAPRDRLIVKLQMALGLPDDAVEEDILQAAIDRLSEENERQDGGGEEDTEDNAEAKSELAALKAQVAVIPDYKKRIETLESENREWRNERFESQAKLLVDEQVESGRLLPDNEKAVESAMTLARMSVRGDGGQSVESFRAIWESHPVIAEPGRIFDRSRAATKGSARASVIAASASEYDSDPGVALGAPRKSWIEASLQDAGHDPVLTKNELESVLNGRNN